FIFFFQAEDGIRDRTVTGVQTCALPISATPPWSCRSARQDHAASGAPDSTGPWRRCWQGRRAPPRAAAQPKYGRGRVLPAAPRQIGRASCRERVKISVGTASVQKKEVTR